jgi:hypothetical protein
MDLLIGIGDLHGHLKALNAILDGCHDRYRIFSDRDRLKLRPGVQIDITGDFIDRGNQNIPVVETVMALKANNPDQVEELFGNHEFLSLSALSSAQYIERRIKSYSFADQPWDSFSWSNILLEEYKENLHGVNGGTAFVQEFGPTPASAFASYVQRMARGGDIGSWMRRLKAYDVQNIHGKKVLLVHGGVPSALRSPEALAEYLERFEEHLETKTGPEEHDEKYRRNPLVGRHSIFWDRSLPHGSPAESIETADKLGVDYIVIGHTPQRNGIASYGGRVFNIDVGMTPKYGEGDPACIVFRKEGIFALYARRGEEMLVDWASDETHTKRL